MTDKLLAEGEEILNSNLTDFCYNIKKHGWDWLHVNSGLERGGKSSFSLQLARKIHGNGLSFDWQNLDNLYFWEKDLAKKLLKVPNQSLVIIDEGAENMFSRQALKKEVTDVIQTLMVYGMKEIFLIINIPDWRWIDSYIRKSRVRSLAVVKTRPRYVKTTEGQRMIRERGFYYWYTRRAVRRASLGSELNQKTTLGTPLFTGKIGAFQNEPGCKDIWQKYLDKKNQFLIEKSNRV